MKNPTFLIWNTKIKNKNQRLEDLASWITKGLKNPFGLAAQQGFYSYGLGNLGTRKPQLLVSQRLRTPMS